MAERATSTKGGLEPLRLEYVSRCATRGLCETLDVSISGYYAWRKRPMSQHQREDGQLADRVQAAYHANRGVYGSPRVLAELQAQGISCARKRVARLMREQGLAARKPRHHTITPHSDPSAQVAPNLLQGDFHAQEPDTKWVADTTSIWTAEGWLAPFGGA